MPLTRKTKEILEGKQSFESKIMKKSLNVKSEDRWRAQKKAKSTAKQSFEDLIFLAKNKPELINNDDVIKLIKTLMEKGNIERWERQVNRLPKELGGHTGINGKGYSQIGELKQKYGKEGWHHGSSVSLKKQLLIAKINLGKAILQTIFNELANAVANPLLSSERIRLIRIKFKNKRFNIKGTSELEVKSEKRQVLHTYDAKTLIRPEVTEEMRYVELPLENDDLSKVSIIVLEKLD